MKKKTVSGIMLTLLLTSMLTLTFNMALATSTEYKVLVDEGHSEWLVSGNAQTLIQALEDKGYIVETFSGMLTQSLLNTYSVLVIGTAWSLFVQSEIQAIEDFVQNGGGLWLTGLGWSWVDYHPGSTIEDYPMNKIAQKFGAFFNPDIIFDPTDYTNVPASAIFHSPFIETHPATQGVNIIGATEAFHGSISIQTGTILTAGDEDSYGGYHESPYPNPGSHPPNCAAIEFGAGKVIVVSQEGFFIDNFIDEYDNKMLGLNIVDWLATPVIPATVDINPDTLNLEGRGQWITAYIQLPEEYNAEDIDATTILLNGTISPVLDPKYEFVTNPSEYLVDYNEDGISERMARFDKAEVISYISESLGFEPADSTEVALTVAGELYDGTPFEGSCVIRAMTPQKKKLKPTLTLIGPWSGAELDAFMPVLRAFEEKTGIDVEYKMYRTEDLISLLPAQFENGTTPGDLIFMWSSRFIEENGQEGHILDVTDLVDETDFLKGTLDPVKVGDTLYGGAYTGKVKPGFWFRKSFFVNNDLTPPTTWAEFLTLLEDIAAIPGIVNPILSGDGVGWPLSDITEHFIATYGGPELHRNLTAGTVAWNSPQIKSIFTDYLVPLLAGDFSDPKTWDTYILNWWNGEYGLYFMGSWITRMVDDPTDLGVFSLPEAPGAEGVVAHTDYFFAPAYTEHPKEAKELFKFLASEEAQSIQVAQGGHIATNIHVPLDAYPPVDRQVAEVVQGKEILTDLDDAIGGVFQVTFWNQLKLLWVAPTQLDDVLNAIEAVAP
jgi:multiple sugar transport system substrate-binding protein